MAFTFNINIIITKFIIVVRNYIKITIIIRIMAIINSLELL